MFQDSHQHFIRPLPHATDDDQLSGIPPQLRSDRSPQEYAEASVNVGKDLAYRLKGTQALEKPYVRERMCDHFHGSDSEGSWIWKDVYEAQEVALVALMLMAGRSLRAMPPEEALTYLKDKQRLCLTHTNRSEEQQTYQQFSTPLPLGYLAVLAARVSEQDIFLEPSAGTGLLAVFGKIHGAKQVVVNELAPNRRAILDKIFGGTAYECNAEYLNDLLPTEILPTVIVMNPPFSRREGMERKRPETLYKHTRSALMRLRPGGRLVLISGANFSPFNANSRDWFVDLQKIATVRGSFGVSGAAYKCHGTQFPTRLTVFDKVPAPNPKIFANYNVAHLNSSELLGKILSTIPAREVLPAAVIDKSESIDLRSSAATPVSSAPVPPATASTARSQTAKQKLVVSPSQPLNVADVSLLSYQAVEFPVFATPTDSLSLFESYTPKRISIPYAMSHPTELCESSALASVLPPIPTYKPLLPVSLIKQGILSSAQLESVVYAGQAHETYMTGYYLVDDAYDKIAPTTSDNSEAVRFRRGWFLGDGTGAGKGRQIAGVLLDNRLQGRTRAIWFSKSKNLIEDARRDWSDLGGNPDDIVNVSDWKLDEEIVASDKILFCTYATLRSERQGKSRLQQIIKWAGKDFAGVIVFDESHELGNAAGSVSDHHGAAKEASQQGVKGLMLQNALPEARVMYVSATGASDVSNLSYTARLGLWGTGEFPFADRSSFIQTIEAGGIAAMEVVCRDLQALGLYLSRSLSFSGVEYEPLDVALSEAQIRLYGQFAEAFKVIHHNIEDALEESGVTGLNKTLNSQAKKVAYSIFESTKQRFFNHVLTAMKVPVLIAQIEKDLEVGYAPVIQLVSTNESLMERRLQEIPESEYQDLNVDITPLEGVLSYLKNSFPIYLYEEYEDDNGIVRSRLVTDPEKNPVICRAALQIRDDLIERISTVPALPGALEQLLHHFGHDDVAEVTGRKTRILKDPKSGKIFVAKRPGNANIDETQSFMDGKKNILVFSGAGNTGRSYHASLSYENQKCRKHYLLESGWRADNAVQGLGRTHRTHQASPPVFCLVSTDVKGEQRFRASIEKRIAALGALTKGQSQSGGQGIFHDTGNLESSYAKKALFHFYNNLYGKKIACCSLAEFEDETGLRLTNAEGYLLDELPTIQRFLNRLLALRIPMQNALFHEFDSLHQGVIEEAKAAGTYETGVANLAGERFSLISQEVLHRHPSTGSETICSEIEQTQRTVIIKAVEAAAVKHNYDGEFLLNSQSGKVAVGYATSVVIGKDGDLLARVALLRPTRTERILRSAFEGSNWERVSYAEWATRWAEELDTADKFTTSHIYVVSGLLLPVWSALAEANPRVYRINLDSGERLLGRVVKGEDMASVARAIGMKGKVNLSAYEMYKAITEESLSFEIGGGLSLRSSSVQGNKRIEVAGNIGELLQRLKIAGCFTEMIGYRTRAFIPVHEDHAIATIENVQKLFQ